MARRAFQQAGSVEASVAVDASPVAGKRVAHKSWKEVSVRWGCVVAVG